MPDSRVSLESGTGRGYWRGSVHAHGMIAPHRFPPTDRVGSGSIRRIAGLGLQPWVLAFHKRGPFPAFEDPFGMPGRTSDHRSGHSDGWRLIPGAERLSRYLLLGLGLDLLFLLVYGGLNLLTSVRAERWNLYLDWELGIPFWPGWILGYASLLVVFLLPPCALSPSAMTDLARRFVSATLIAALAFLLFPAELGFERVDVIGLYGPSYRLLHSLDLPHNLVPSLHVTYSTLTLAALGSVSGPWVRGLFALWLGIICLSTVLVHQHHLLDVAGGLALGAWLHLRDSRSAGKAR